MLKNIQYITAFVFLFFGEASASGEVIAPEEMAQKQLVIQQRAEALRAMGPILVMGAKPTEESVQKERPWLIETPNVDFLDRFIMDTEREALQSFRDRFYPLDFTTPAFNTFSLSNRGKYNRIAFDYSVLKDSPTNLFQDLWNLLSEGGVVYFDHVERTVGVPPEIARPHDGEGWPDVYKRIRSITRPRKEELKREFEDKLKNVGFVTEWVEESSIQDPAFTFIAHAHSYYSMNNPSGSTKILIARKLMS